MRRITTPSSLAWVAVPVFALVVVTSCATGTPAASPAPGAGAGSLGELPAAASREPGAGTTLRSAKKEDLSRTTASGL